MRATQPPTENQLATRKAILELTAAKLAPLQLSEPDLAALPAWLWSLPAENIARSLALTAPMCALELARKLEAETARRHPAERFVAYLAERHPHLSHVQRARLAEFAQALQEAGEQHGAVTPAILEWTHGITAADCARYGVRAKALIEAVAAAERPRQADDTRAPLDRLRAAGELAHARRAFADGELEISPAKAAMVNAATREGRPQAVAAS